MNLEKKTFPHLFLEMPDKKKETQKKFDVVFCAKRVVKWPRIRNKGGYTGYKIRLRYIN